MTASRWDRRRKQQKIVFGILAAFLAVGLLASSLPGFFLSGNTPANSPQTAEQQPVKTAAELEKALKDKPEDKALLAELAGAYLREGQSDKAVETYEKAVALAPENGDMRQTLAMTYFINGNYDKSAAHMQEELKRHPDNKEAHLLYGQVLGYGKKDYPAAIKELEKYIELAGEGNDAVKARQMIEELKDMSTQNN